MNRFRGSVFLRPFFFVFVLLTCLAVRNVATAAHLTISWDDQSSNEEGFNIRRRTPPDTYPDTPIGTIGANNEAYHDTELEDGTQYCYRVWAYTNAGEAGSEEACETTPAATATDLGITKNDGVTTAVPGQSVTYTIIATNAGPGGGIRATVVDTFPATLTCTWTCVGASGGTCAASGSGDINDATVKLPKNGSVTYTATCTISASATGTIVTTASVTALGGVTDLMPGNNSATDTNTIGPCLTLATLTPPNRRMLAGGGGMNVNVTTPGGCGWTAVSNVPWVKITEGGSGSGNGMVAYSVAANEGPNPRRGTLTVAGKTLIVSQGTPVPPPCTITVPPSITIGPGGEAWHVTVTASTGSCVWQARSHVPWITISGASGSGSGEVQYNVEANNGGLRRGRITVNGKRVTFTQP